MGMASGESDACFGTDVGNWGAKGAGNFFWACRRGKLLFYPMCLYSKCSDFVDKSNMGEKHEKNVDPLT